MVVWQYLQVLAPIFGLVVCACVQVIIARYIPKVGLLNSVFAGFTGGFITIIGMDVASLLRIEPSLQEKVAQFLVTILTYASLGYGFFHFVNMGETARRVRIVRELLDSPEGLTREELRARYNSAEIVAARLGRMIRTDQVVCRDNRFYVGTPILLCMAKTIVAMKRLLIGKPSEFG